MVSIRETVKIPENDLFQFIFNMIVTELKKVLSRYLTVEIPLNITLFFDGNSNKKLRLFDMKISTFFLNYQKFSLMKRETAFEKPLSKLKILKQF